jgi:heat shock protein HslJ
MMPARYALLLLAIAASSASASEPFPFGSELMLDTVPLYGSKRVPTLEIEENGDVTIDLWCASTKGQASVGESSITVVAEPSGGAQCPPERQTGDQDFLTALSQVTNWRRDGDIVELTGGVTLRFRLMTN